MTMRVTLARCALSVALAVGGALAATAASAVTFKFANQGDALSMAEKGLV